MYPDFPSNEDFNKLAKGVFRGQKFKEYVDNINDDVTDVDYFLKGKDVSKWKLILSNKISHIQLSYSCACYYALKMNDDDWHKPLPEGGEIFYPFDADQACIKSMFDFFIGSCFNYIFSAFDIIGQIVNEKYELGLSVSKVSFNKICDNKRLEKTNSDLNKVLNEIKNGTQFKNVDMRNAFTHRIPPTELIPLYAEKETFIVNDERRKGQELTLKGIDNGKKVTIISHKSIYTPSKQIVIMTDEALSCLLDTIKLL